MSLYILKIVSFANSADLEEWGMLLSRGSVLDEGTASFYSKSKLFSLVDLAEALNSIS